MSQHEKVAFLLPSAGWLGGRNYLRNLFAALQSVSSSVVPVILTGKRAGEVPADFIHLEILKTSLLDRNSIGWFFRKVVSLGLSQDLLLKLVLQRRGISVLSHCFNLGRQTSLKTIGWIPDFQHIHLPEFFSKKELDQRNRDFIRLCVHCDTIVVSSACVQADLGAFAPAYAGKGAVLQFVASPAPLDRATSLTELQSLYGFDGPYFLLPNQFWAHKNHRVVLEALKILKQRSHPLLVLATGSTQDHRNLAFFSSLMRHAGECNVLDCFRVLGQIPFDHLVGLMQHATAFINPSLFEGWSTSVEEAKSMGKQIVLSDLPIHREQSPGRSFFFPPDNPEALASGLLAAEEAYEPGSDGIFQRAARAHFPDRQRAYGEAYLNILSLTLAK